MGYRSDNSKCRARPSLQAPASLSADRPGLETLWLGPTGSAGVSAYAAQGNFPMHGDHCPAVALSICSDTLCDIWGAQRSQGSSEAGGSSISSSGVLGPRQVFRSPLLVKKKF